MTNYTKFYQLLHDQIRQEFNASHQCIATATWFDNADMPKLAKFFYARALEENKHAMMIIQYFVDRNIDVELTGVDATRSTFASATESIDLSLETEKRTTDQIVRLANAARSEGDYLGEEFMGRLLADQIEKVAYMTTLARIAKRAGNNLFELEAFVAREMSKPKDPRGAPSAAGGPT